MDADRLKRLSPQMREVYDLDQAGLTPQEIGRRLLLSEFSVRNFLEVIQERLSEGPRDDEL